MGHAFRVNRIAVWSALVALLAASLVLPVNAAYAAGPVLGRPGPTVQVNVMPGGEPGSGYATNGVISADGSTVVFSDYEDSGSSGVRRIFARDRATSTTTVVDLTTDGQSLGGNGQVIGIDVSSTGRYVVFATQALRDADGADLPRECVRSVWEDGGELEVASPCSNVFLRDLVSETTTRLSPNGAFGQRNALSVRPSISADGSRVVFLSTAVIEPAEPDVEPVAQIVLYDSAAAGLELVSVGTDGAPADASSGEPDISADGGHVVFGSNATNLVEFDEETPDIFIRHLATATTELLQTDAYDPTVNHDGSVVSFHTQLPLLPSDDEGAVLGDWDVYVLDRSAGELHIPGGGGLRQTDDGFVSEDGRSVVFRRSTSYPELPGISVYDLGSRTSEMASVRSDGTVFSDGQVGGGFGDPYMSGDGRFVVFSSYEDGLQDIFVHDRALLGETASGDGSADTDGEGDGATFTEPLEVRVSGSSGLVTIEKLVPGDPSAVTSQTLEILGQPVNIAAAAPVGPFLQVRFRIDASIIPPGTEPEAIALSRDGTSLAACPAPDSSGPCLAQREVLSDGDLLLTAHSPTASIWSAVDRSKSSSLSGTVKAAADPGQEEVPVKGATITVFDAITHEVKATAKADLNGYYTLPELPAGEVKIRAAKNGYATTFSTGKASLATADHVTLQPQGSHTQDFTLVQGVTLSGTVKIHDAEVAGARVTVLDPDGKAVRSGTTDDDGVYSIPRLAPGQVNVRVLADGSQTPVFQALTLTDDPLQTLDFDLLQGATLSGVVTVDGEAVAGARVTVLDADGKAVRSGTTDGGGGYSIPRLAPGQVKVRVVATGYLTEVKDLTLALDPPTSLDFALVREVIAYGAVTTDGTGVADARVTVLDPDGKALRSATTDEWGGFWITRLAPGPVTVRVVAAGFLTEFRDVTLDAGHEWLHFALVPEVTLSGSVSVDGAGVADARVTVLGPDGKALRSATTDVEGGFSIARLEPGTEPVTVRVVAAGYLTEFRDLTLDAGSSPWLDFALVPEAKVTGTVNAPAVVAALDPDSATAVVIRSVKAVDPEGDGTYTFSLGQLPTGRYKLRVNHADYKAAFYGGANLNKATAFVLENPGDEFVAGHFELVPKP